MSCKNLSRRDFLKAAAAASILPVVSAGQASERRPNILFMLADDHALNCMGYAGNPIIRTPNMDRLAEEGIYFKNAFVTTAICCCSRASILTGQYMCRHGIKDFATPLSAKAFEQTYPALLRKAGYRTGYIGKYAIGADKEAIKNLSLPEDKFDYWYGFPQGISYMQEEDGKTRYLTSLMTEKAIEFLKTNPDEQPFCLTIGFKEPHGPMDYFDPNFPDFYKDVNIPPPKTMTKESFNEVPDFIRSTINVTRQKSLYVNDVNAYEEMIRTIYRQVSRMDKAVGDILEALQKLDLKDNTIVIYTSDNGELLGAHGLIEKWLMYEESIRVPLMIYDPRRPWRRPGREDRQMVLNIDLAPTILDMAGVPIPAGMQGKSLVPIIEGKKKAIRKDWYYEHEYVHQNNIVPSEGVRTEEWKYIRYYKQEPVYEQLFNLKDDPLEECDLAANPKCEKILARLRKRCQEYRKELE